MSAPKPADREGTRRGSARSGRSRRALALVPALALVVAAPAPAPHTALESSSPAAEAETTDPVEEIRLRFTTTVQPALSTIEVSGEAGPVDAVGSAEEVPGTGQREIRVRMARPLEAGRYRVSWRTAGPDGHPVQGEFEFRVTQEAAGAAPRAAGEQEPAGVPPAEEQEAQEQEEAAAGTEARGAAAAETVIRWLFYLSIVGMLGTVAFRLLVLPQATRGPDVEGAVAAAARGAWVLGWVAGGLGLLALPARLWDQSVGLFGADALVAENLGALLFGTAWGGGWMLQAACLGLFLLGAAWAAPAGTRRRGWLAMAAAAAGIAVVPGLQGHAWNADGRELALLNHSLHVVAVGVWMGGLGTMVLAGLPALRRLPRPGKGRRPSVGPRRAAPEVAGSGSGGGAPEAAGVHTGSTGGGAEAATDAAGPAGGAGAAAGEPPPPTDDDAPPPRDSARPGADAPPLLAAMVDGFSRVALGAVTLLVGTGLINAWIHLNEPGELFSTGYGRALLVKVGIVAGALALGFYNWRNVRPSLRESPRPGLLRIPATLEFLLGLGVLLATALLVAQGVPT